jgi:hypothetical protein
MHITMRVAPLFLFVALLQGGVARADLTEDVRSGRAAVERAESARQEREQRQRQLLGESRSLANQIDALKHEPEGVRRDARLRTLLAAAQGKSDELERLSAEDREGSAALQLSRRNLIAVCDKALMGRPPESVRLELIRLRAQELARLATPPTPLMVAPATGAAATSLDGPRELQEKADVLRDSEDKLRREARRLAQRIDGLERRRRLKERADAVDEDWFSESLSSRRAARAEGTIESRQDGQGDRATNSPAASGATGGGFNSPPLGGGGGSTGGPGGGPMGAGRGGESAVLRNLVDPATLAELDRVDPGDDFERQNRALRRAKSELEGLAKDLDRRAKILEERAVELRKKK